LHIVLEAKFKYLLKCELYLVCELVIIIIIIIRLALCHANYLLWLAA